MRGLRTFIGFATVVAWAASASSALGDAGGSGCPQSSGTAGPPPAAQLGRPLNEVALENCQSGTEQIESKLRLARASGQQAQPTNLAYAYSHDCATGCTTIAVAYQVVLVDKDSPTQSPQNAAVAINQNCTGCRTFAFADQYAVDVPSGTRLPPATRRQIASIRRQADADVNAGLSFPDLDAQLKALATQLHQDVLDGLANQNVNHPGHRDRQQDVDREQPAP